MLNAATVSSMRCAAAMLRFAQRRQEAIAVKSRLVSQSCTSQSQWGLQSIPNPIQLAPSTQLRSSKAASAAAKMPPMQLTCIPCGDETQD